jgi:glycosyltransferase involved in cell wall biosynthesis
VAENENYVFLFASTSPFIDHPNVKFINEIHNLQKKSNFINTCDAMLHGRQLGESFGLSIAEFLALNKPVMAWGKGLDLNHVDMLKDSGLLYNDQVELKEMLLNIKDFTNKEDWSKRVEQYNPTAVMTKFNEVFMS